MKTPFIKFGIIVAAFFAILSASNAASPKEENMKQNELNKLVLTRLINEVWSKGNLGAVDELVAPAYHFEDGKVTGHWQVVDRLGFYGQVRPSGGTL